MEQIRCTTARPRGYGFLIAIWILTLAAVAMVIYTLFPPSERTMAEAIDAADTHRAAETYRYLRYRDKLEACQPYLGDLEDGEYQALFLAMYSLENYAEEDFGTYRGINTLKLEPAADNTMELAGMLELLLSSDILPERIYLGLDPVKLKHHLVWEEEPDWQEMITALSQEYEELQWEILLSYPSLAEWLELSDEERRQTVSGHEQAVETLVEMDNMQLFYIGGKEWLICNQDNYTDRGVLNASVSHNLLLQVFCDHKFQVTEINQEEVFEELEETLELWQEDAPDIKERTEYTLVFLGDSIIGNYTDSLSVPGVVQNFTGAKAVNCGYGGICLSEGEAGICGVDVVNSLIGGLADAIPDNVPAHSGIQKLNQSAIESGKLVFFLNYGINDYMVGHPVESEDAYDLTTYKGALRTAIERLQQTYPEARIVVMTPTFINTYENGNQRMSEVGGVMTDYVEAAVAVSQEYDIPCMNNYRDMEVDAENEKELLADGVHPNEKGRFRMGLLICRKLNELLP